VVAELFQRGHLGADGHFTGKDTNAACAALDDRATRARSLKADEERQIARVWQTVQQMVQYATSGHHAAGRHNDAGIEHFIDLFGILLLQCEGEPGPGQR